MRSLIIARPRTLFASLFLLLTLVMPLSQRYADPVAAVAITEAIGSGPAMLACFTCLVGAATIVIGGPPAWIAALLAPGGVFILAGCIGACAGVALAT